jgi:hypothetical protein
MLVDDRSSSMAPRSDPPPRRPLVSVLLVGLLVGFSAAVMLSDDGSDGANQRPGDNDGDDGGIDGDVNGTQGDAGTDGEGNDTGAVDDADRDGVADGRDQCPSTPRHVDVDAVGCRAPLQEGVWMHTRFGGKSAMFDGDNMSTWNQTLASIEAYGLFIDEIDDFRNLEALTAGLAQHEVDLVVESGGTLQFAPCNESNGVRSAEIELAKIDPIYQAGGHVDFLTLDGPISRTIVGGRGDSCGVDLNTSVTWLVDYVQTVHDAHPEIGFGLLVNFPNWVWGDIPAYQCEQTSWGEGIHYGDVLNASIAALRSAGLPLTYVVADSPWGYVNATEESACRGDVTAYDWMGRLLELEALVEDHDLPFVLILNDKTGGEESDEAFATSVLDYLEAHQGRGGSPTVYLVESWYDYPEFHHPETQEGTFTYLTLDVIARLAELQNEVAA